MITKLINILIALFLFSSIVILNVYGLFIEHQLYQLHGYKYSPHALGLTVLMIFVMILLNKKLE